MSDNSENYVIRRRVPRRDFESPVGVLVDGVYGLSQAYQVGEGGMMISSFSPILRDRQVVVSFYINQNSLVLVRGVVRSVVAAAPGRPERYGIEFVDLEFQYRREIRNFVAAATFLKAVYS